MRLIEWGRVLAATIVVALAGCSKSSKPSGTQQVDGISIDMPKLGQSFSATTNAEALRLLSEATMGLRYRDYPKSMMALEELSKLPDITEAQKKMVADVFEQEKKLANSAPAQ